MNKSCFLAIMGGVSFQKHGLKIGKTLTLSCNIGYTKEKPLVTQWSNLSQHLGTYLKVSCLLPYQLFER